MHFRPDHFLHIFPDTKGRRQQLLVLENFASHSIFCFMQMFGASLAKVVGFADLPPLGSSRSVELGNLHGEQGMHAYRYIYIYNNYLNM